MSDENRTPEKTPKKPAKFKEIEPIAFEGDLNSSIIPEDILCKEILPKLFATSFHDFCGSKIRQMDGSNPLLFNTGIPKGALYLDLYFKYQGEASKDGPIQNLLPINAPEDGQKKNDMYSRLVHVSGSMNSSRMFKVTPETYQILSEVSFNEKFTRWDAQTQEVASNTLPYTKDEVFVKISGISLDKTISLIYGKGDKNCMYYYSCQPASIRANDPRMFNIQITRLASDALAKLQAYNGIYAPQRADDFYMYTR